MKKILLIAVAGLLMVGCLGKKSETKGVKTVVVGQVNDLPDGWIYLSDRWNKEAAVDSVKVVGGAFSFEITGAEPSFYMLSNEQGMIASFFSEKGKVSLSGHVAHNQVSATGTPANDAYVVFAQEARQLSENYEAAEHEEDAEAIIKHYNALIAKTTEANLSNVLSLLMLQMQSYEMTGAETLKKLGTLAEPLQSHSQAQSMKSLAERKMRTEPQTEGSDYIPHYIDIEVADINGNKVSLKSVVEQKSNRYVLLDFWASWCRPCMMEMPTLKEAYAKYHAAGFEIFGVSLDSKEQPWKGASKHINIEWVNTSPLQGFSCSEAEEYAVEAIPTNYLIDCATGVIIAKNLRGEEVLKKLSTLLEK